MSKEQARQFRNVFSFTCTCQATGWKIHKFNRLRRMTILCQDEMAYSNCICSFEGFHYCWNNCLYTRTTQDPLMAKAIDHIDTKESHTSLHCFFSQIAPGNARQIAQPFNN